jgi:hypothetical protein
MPQRKCADHRHMALFDRSSSGLAGRFWLLTAGWLLVHPNVAGATSPLFASAVGGSQSASIRAIATDGEHNIYIVGETYSADFPVSTAWSAARRAGDAFILKLDPSGSEIRFAVILSGAAYDSARALAVDSRGNVYVTGVTTSTDFPVTAGALQRFPSSPGLEDAFVAKLDPTGALVYATYLGGNSSDLGYAITIDSGGAAYVAGSTNSMNFPVTANAPQPANRGGSDCFVAKLDPAGAQLSYSTYLGGENIDVCKSIAVDANGSAFVSGTTLSGSFPTNNALKKTLSGASDAFLTKLSPAGDRFLFSTYLGGEGAEDGNVVRLSSTGDVYLAGDTTSAGFSVTAGAVQRQNNGWYDGYVCAVDNDGSHILFATYLGGSGADSISDLVIGDDGRIVIAGYTASTDFPMAQGFQTSFGGVYDAFVAVLGASGSTLDLASYIGGGGDDRANGVALLKSGQLVVAGQFQSGSVPYIDRRFSSSASGNQNGFLAAVSYTKPLRFVPITPCRLADTRNAASPFGGPAMAGGSSRDFAITASACGVPGTAEAYFLNVAVVPAGPLGFLTAWPSGQPRPTVSTLNSLDGRVRSSGAIIPAGAAGAISIFASNPTHVILDIAGYFVPAGDPTALAYYPLLPCRIADTRTVSGALGGPSLQPAQSRTFPIAQASACNIPASARAYSLNMTLVPNSPVGYLTAWPTGAPRPFASTMNASAPVATANSAIVAAGSGGSIDVYTTNATDLVIDINGYFAPPSDGGLSLYTIGPCRVLDTRQPAGSSSISGTLDVYVTTSPCGIAPAAQAYVLAVTAIPVSSLGFLTLWPQGQTRPLASTLNALDGLTSNMAIIPTTNGLISAFPSNPAHLVIDIFSYFAP